MTDIDTRSTDSTAKSLAGLPIPPGPRLPRFIQTMIFGRKRDTWLPKLERKYGDVFRLSIFPDRHVVSISRAEHIRAVFTGSPQQFHAGEGNTILKPIMGEHSVLTTDEDEHRRIRKLLMPPFHGAALRGYREMVDELAKAEVATWRTGTPFRSHDRMQTLTLEIILRVVFGVSEGPRLNDLRRSLGELVTAPMILLLGGHLKHAAKIGPWRRIDRLQRHIDDLLYAEIGDRRKVGDLGERADVLSRLLAVEVDGDRLTDAELRDQLITLLLAGHETTATALAWTLHELARDPRTLARATEAADAGEDEYLEAAVKEAMRLHPVIFEVARRLTEDMEIGGYRVPAGHTVMPAIGLVQADPLRHDDPGGFDPERFLDGRATPTNWLPFGGGVRRCLGAGFSLLEATVALRAVLTRYDIEPDRAEPEPAMARNITFTPSRGAMIVVRPR